MAKKDIKKKLKKLLEQVEDIDESMTKQQTVIDEQQATLETTRKKIEKI